MEKIDLHIHSKYSDGSLTVKDVIELCIDSGISAISITDHDEIAGNREAKEFCLNRNIQVISGIEITTTWKIPLHILAYDFDDTKEEMINLCKNAKMYRLMEFSSIIGKLKKNGINVDAKKMLEMKINSVSELAKYLYSWGLGESVQDVKRKFFSYGGIAFVNKKGPSLENVISLVHECGGKAILAHPGRMRVSNQNFWSCIEEIKEKGIDGIEVYSPHNHNSDELLSYCLTNHLIYTGGSDFHSKKGGAIGINNRVPLSWIKK